MVVILVGFLFVAPSALAQDDDAAPVAGRPEDFSGLAGVYRITTRAEPTDLHVEDALTLIIRITGAGPQAHQPRRENLRLFPPRMKEEFFIEPLPDKDRRLEPKPLEREKSWEFAYRLRPKHDGVTEVPNLKLIYYHPGRRKFQSSYSKAIELHVKPRPAVPPPKDAVAAISAPAGFFELAPAVEVLRGQRTWRLDHPLILLACLVVPPALFGLWFWLGLRARQNGVHRDWLQRSQAAQRALHLLQRIADPDGADTFSVVAGYLHERLDLPMAEPGPIEVGRFLGRTGVGKGLRNRFVEFFQACDAARFSPNSYEPRRLVEQAGALIQALEDQWARQRVKGKRRESAFSFFLLLFALAAADPGRHSEDRLAELADAEFRKGQETDDPAQGRKAFAAAAGHYEELHKRGVRNPALYLNLGNSQYLAGNLPGAVFSFRRGLRLAPAHAILRENLEFARSRVGYPNGTRPAGTSWPPWFPRPSSNVFLALACTCQALGWLALARRLWTGQGTGLVWLLFMAAGLCIVTWGTGQWHLHQESRDVPVVITDDDVPFLRGNGDSYPSHPDLPALNRGMEARLLSSRGDWLQTQLASGQVGWVPSRQVLIELEALLTGN